MFWDILNGNQQQVLETGNVIVHVKKRLVHDVNSESVSFYIEKSNAKMARIIDAGNKYLHYKKVFGDIMAIIVSTSFQMILFRATDTVS